MTSFEIARVFAGLNEKTQAMDWLEKSFDTRRSELRFVAVDPLFDNIRSEKRFTTLLARMHLPAPAPSP
jgi:hypothetical protein